MSFTEFLLRSTVVFTVLFLPYQLWFRRQTFFTLRRFYLLAAGCASLLLPFLPAFAETRALNGELLPVFVSETFAAESAAAPVPGWSLFLAIYVSGLAVFSALFFFRLFRLLLLIRRSERDADGICLLPPASREGAFSFLGTIFLPAGIDAETRRAVLRHERVHVRQKHTLDILFYELLILLFWFNPLYRLVRRQLSATHEFIADEQACGGDAVHYKQVLVAHVLGLPRETFVHHFSEPGNLKQRLIMLTKNRTSSRARFGYIILLPLAALALSLNAFTFAGGDGTADKMPEFKGGSEAMHRYLSDNLAYPAEAKAANVEGMVMVSFTVAENGKVTGAKVLKSVAPSLDAEALRVVSSMPDWIPGEKNGKKVPVEMTLPVRFALGNGAKQKDQGNWAPRYFIFKKAPDRC